MMLSTFTRFIAYTQYVHSKKHRNDSGKVWGKWLKVAKRERKRKGKHAERELYITWSVPSW